MPRTKIGTSPFEENERLLISNIKYEMDLRGYKKTDLKKILNLSEPAINKRYKEPRWFRYSELMMIARWLRIPISNLFAKRVTERLTA